ncbi:hypothetical protein ABZX98_25065 [Streptomyces sp. NPDC002992]|uniref:hypothetical protein n=1 Tax=Streptomyces sp. NPDC002992 TaxID=3154273 RepID=UPI0033ABFEDF
MAASVARYLTKEAPAWSDDATLKARWDAARASYLALLDRAAWFGTAREGLAAGDWRMNWLVEYMAPEIDPRAFRDDGPRAEEWRV